MSDPKIPPDLELYIDALLVIDGIDDAKELLINPALIEDLEFHEAPSNESETEL